MSDVLPPSSPNTINGTDRTLNYYMPDIISPKWALFEKSIKEGTTLNSKSFAVEIAVGCLFLGFIF